MRLEIRGAVQGVGFRPFVYRLAREHGLAGWVSNTAMGVVIEVEGLEETLRDFQRAVSSHKPRLAIIDEVSSRFIQPEGFHGFEIRKSSGGRAEALVLPDIATCDKCISEIRNPEDRRYRYPFTNCTDCGPRYSIVRSLPYDRPNTSMARFEMCPDCRREYEDPLDRRFHAQPNACPVCGPHLELWDPSGKVLATGDGSLLLAAEAVMEGRIVAVKGLGGFHLMVRADTDLPVTRLRERKGRRMKPFALMFPDLASVYDVCTLSASERDILTSPQAPIVLLKKKRDPRVDRPVSRLVSPENPELGVMLPYTPLHIILMDELGIPVVATSGNLSDEPICTDEREALVRLCGLADLFLVHDRPIVRHVDDSIVRIFRDGKMILRRARGYAPLPLRASCGGRSVLATGAHLKNTLALSVADNIFVSQHIGDLETEQAMDAFDEVRNSIESLYDAKPEVAACDLHPDYYSSVKAGDTGLKTLPLQHHIAHVYSCMLDAGTGPPLLGVAWDGTGYGGDGTVWGGEFFRIGDEGNARLARFRHFPLPGGDAAVKEPRRSALGLLSVFLEDPFSGLPAGTFTELEERMLGSMLESGLNSPLTSSVGRLFDAVASLLGLHQKLEFEAQAAMALQHCADAPDDGGEYPFSLEEEEGILVVDWEPMVRGILEDMSRDLKPGAVSARFHNTLAGIVLAVARIAGEHTVALSGGCFQNQLLLEKTCSLLEGEGFRPVHHSRLPANDGGIAPGQVLAALDILGRT